MIDTNVIVSPLVDDEFADDSILFLRRAKEKGHLLLISPVVLSELYTWVYLDPKPRIREQELKEFLRITGISVIMSISEKIVRRAGELHAEYIEQRYKRRRILPDFLIGAYAESFADVFITWNTKDFRLKIPVKTPREIIREL